MDLDVGNAGRMERSGDVAPAHLNGPLLPFPKSHDPLLRPIAGDNAAVAAAGACRAAIASIMVLAVPRDMSTPSER